MRTVTPTAAEANEPPEITRLMASLGEAEANLLRARFGLDVGRPRTLSETGSQLGMTPKAVAEAEAEILTRLKRRPD